MKKLRNILFIILLLILTYLLGYLGGQYNMYKFFNSYQEEIKEISNIDVEELLETMVILHQAYDKNDKNIDKDFTKRLLPHIVKEYSQDDYAEYISKSKTNKGIDKLTETYEGIGITMGSLVKDKSKNTNIKQETVIVNNVLPGTPAKKVGLKKGDTINSVNGVKVKDIEEVGKIIKENKDVEIEINRGGKLIKKELTSTKIYTPSLLYEAIQVDDESTDKNYTIAFIKIIKFGTNLGQELKEILEQDHNIIDGFVFSVEGNGGGMLSSAEEVLSLLTDNNEYIYHYINSIDNKKENKFSKKDNVNYFKPSIIIQDGLSASASELFTLSLNNIYNDNVLILGEKSYGKGTIQTVHELQNKDFLKFTVGKWFVGDIPNITEKGIEPEIELVNNLEYDMKKKLLELIKKYNK